MEGEVTLNTLHKGIKLSKNKFNNKGEKDGLFGGGSEVA